MTTPNATPNESATTSHAQPAAANEVTLDHIRAAAEWARTAEQPTPLDGTIRRYDQGQWDCGTACCIWGAASILAGNGPAKEGPPQEWRKKDAQHRIVSALMCSGGTRPEQILEILTRADLTGANLTGADLTGADLTDADLTRANLTDADLTDAWIWLGDRRLKLA